MSKQKSLAAAFFLTVFLLGLSAAAWAQTKEEVVSSMRARHPALQEAKDKGLVGEAWNGLTALVKKDAGSGYQELVDEENQDRLALFTIIARETGTSIEEVARQNRIRMYRLATDSHFIQDQNREWVRKGGSGL